MYIIIEDMNNQCKHTFEWKPDLEMWEKDFL